MTRVGIAITGIAVALASGVIAFVITDDRSIARWVGIGVAVILGAAFRSRLADSDT